MTSRLKDEIKSFETLWKGGFYEGDPLNPLARSSYGQMGYMSVLHVIYLRCIKPYINEKTIALEIGPGRGAWTKALLPSKEIHVMDALSAEHNKFFEYLGHPKNVQYFQVKDFECKVLPDNYFNYMFSFGCLCHVSFDGITQYATNIYPKLRSGSNCFWMVADYAKYNNAMSNLGEISILPAVFYRDRYLPLRWLLKCLVKGWKKPLLAQDMVDEHRPGRWYDAGIERTCAMLRKIGYQIVDPDVGVSFRDPIIHFIKP